MENKNLTENKASPRINAVEKLENYLLVNHLPPNSKIPSERDLCALWNVNRTTLRFAVDMLIDSGKLYRKKGSGTFVAEPKLPRNLLGVNSFASEMRQHGTALTTKILSFRTLECTKQISKKLHVPLGNKIYEIIRVRTVLGQPCIMETTYINADTFPNFENYNLEKDSMYSIFTNIYKKKIICGEEKISVTYVTKEEASFLEIQPDSPVFFATGITMSSEHEPLEYYKLIFRADRFKFVSVTHRTED
jgi:GntR family transcriptional regulator